MIENPIFIVGTERSGSNLLHLLIHQTGQVSTPHPPHLMRDLSPLLKNYGDLENESSLRRLIRHAIQLVHWHFAPWPVELKEEEVREQIIHPTLYSVYASIYEIYRKHDNKSRWCCKSTFMINHVQDALNHHLRPQFVHLVRDPRDVAASAKKSIFSFYHPYFVAKLWAKEQSSAMEWSRKLPPHTWFTLHYEKLLENPEFEMKRLCEFLKLPYTPEILEYFHSSAAKNLASLSESWGNVQKPILKSNSRKFMTALWEEEVGVIEHVAREPMSFYGYKPVAQESSVPSEKDIKNYALLEKIMKVTTEGKALLKDKNSWRRHRKKLYLNTLKVKVFSQFL